jgi:hypothetical protein
MSDRFAEDGPGPIDGTLRERVEDRARAHGDEHERRHATTPRAASQIASAVKSGRSIRADPIVLITFKVDQRVPPWADEQEQQGEGQRHAHEREPRESDPSPEAHPAHTFGRRPGARPPNLRGQETARFPGRLFSVWQPSAMAGGDDDPRSRGVRIRSRDRRDLRVPAQSPASMSRGASCPRR